MAMDNVYLHHTGDTVGLAPRSQQYLIWLILSIIPATFVYFIDRANNSVVFSTLFYYLILFIHLGRIIKRDTKIDWLAPDLLFLISYSLFSYGYITLYILNVVPYDLDIFFFEDYMPFALFIINLGAIFFMMGYEFGFSNLRDSLRIHSITYIAVPHRVWYFSAWFLMITAMIFYFGTLSLIPTTTLLRDTYYVIAHMGEYVRYPIFFFISDRIFLAGAVIYFATSIYRSGKLFNSKLGMIVIIGFMIITMLGGQRGPVIKLLVATICACWYGIGRIKFRWLVVLASIVFFSIGAIRILRHTAGLDIRKAITEYQYQKEQQPLPLYVQTITEFGGSVKVVNGTVGFLQGNQYWWGSSLVQAFAGTLTRRLTAGWGQTPSGWMTYNMYGPDAGGTGFSIVAEGYLNFGFIGIFLVMFGVGYILRRLYIRLLLVPGLINLALLLIGISGAIFWVRQNGELVIPLFMRMLIACAIINYIFPPQYVAVKRRPEESMEAADEAQYVPLGYQY